MFKKDLQYYKFCAYGFLKNMRFFDPFILLFFRENGCSYLQIGILFSIREIANTILEVPSGFVADYLGRKSSMLFAFIAYIISFIIFTLWGNYYLFMLAMFLFAAGEAFRSGTHKAMIIDYLNLHDMSKLKTEYYGSTRSWSQFGSAISSIIAGVLVFYTGEYRIIFAASIIPYLLDFLNLATYPEILNGKTGNQKNKKFDKAEFFKLAKTKKYRRGLMNSAIYDGIFKSIKDYLQPILKSFALGLPIFIMLKNDQRSAIIIAIVYFVLFFLSALASKNSYQIKNFFSGNMTKAINITFLIGLVITIISGFAQTVNIEILSVLLFIIIYVLQNFRRPITMDYITDHIPENLMATGLSVESQTKTILVAILSPVIGLLADLLGVGYAIGLVALLVLLSYPFLKVK